ncbi:hypothetical protein STCU_04822 [Strigomonas culicis]|uniref:Uncharacterized protein n=1 Tax=Strigomonas culicis TaxID=28005 RepID=S9VPC0_9TRYP|nr:hypothetical protein STCU_04822 [Strigomonas culicis]|eukprot:EPY28906.1 hypothetical protein STCU_04822 [Strigomonas culicis]
MNAHAMLLSLSRRSLYTSIVFCITHIEYTTVMESEKKVKADAGAAKGKHANKEHPEKKGAAIDRQKSEQESNQAEAREGPKPKQSNRDAAPKEKKEDSKAAVTGPVIHVNQDLSAGAKWAKGNGPSFADMVRHKTREMERKPQAAHEGTRREERKQQHHHKAEAEAPRPAKQATPPPPTPPPAVAALEATPAEPVAPPAPEVPPAVRKTPVPAPSATFYVLEVERVDAVKLPAHVVKTAEGRSQAYTFSAQPGNPPPPPSAQPQTIFRQDAANLNPRQWNASDARPTSQWSYNSQGAEWPVQGERNFTASRVGPAFSYNSYGVPAQQQQQQQAVQQPAIRGGHNFFPNRLRPEPNAFAGGRTAGGGVW